MKQINETTFTSDNGLITFIHGDCMKFMENCRENEFDLAVVDPPYGIGYDGAKQTSGSHGGRKAHNFKGWDSKIPDKIYFDELYRISKNQIIWGANYFVQYLKPSMGWIVWRKNRGKFSSSDAELAYTSFDRALREYTKNPLELSREGGTIHPTQKMICLYSWIFKNYAKSADHILDTHGGLMSSAIAAHMEGLKMTIIELDKEYFDKAIQRFSIYEQQQTINFE